MTCWNKVGKKLSSCSVESWTQIREILSFALLFFCKGFESKKSTNWKKKNRTTFLPDALVVRVGKIEIPCFLTLFGSGKRRFFQTFYFWAVSEPGFWCRNFKHSNTKWNILSYENFSFLLTYLNVWANQSMLLKYELLTPAQHHSKRLPR